ncbi:hypothetical protein F0562_007961 [Nyssa sinensis]|uniref:Uncharacterized protein n=1 Tax=Nyssa sinensis TaxID=561372 RepID=A0A5J5A6Q0_9ASTE|nr:hypothetical protein F0562_007961 [Nyssa sinensis]
MGLLYSSVASGRQWQFFCRRYLVLVGCFNSHMLDRSLTVTVANECLCDLHSTKVQGSCMGWPASIVSL